MINPLTTTQICNFLKHNTEFIGCFPSDMIPKDISRPCSIIVNTGNSSSPGEHWIALYLTWNNVFYFDSFGLPILEMDIINYLKPYYDHAIYSKKCIQDMSSAACGLYTIAFVENVKNEETFKQFLNLFKSHNLKKNDDIVLKYMTQLF